MKKLIANWKDESKKIQVLAEKENSRAARHALISQSIRFCMCAGELETTISAICKMQREIIGELCRALMLLGAKSDLLGTVGSWGDSLPESVVLADLRSWNEATEREIS